ncbi:sensor protein TorS [mine drainage metagenome]|uniref:histidine kinase n=1 Tax=mine drainage metagenome TaxID=410659 RepID=A0A1J5P5C9_9ZZZZ
MRATDDWILADPSFVQRILRNLLDNALRYTPSGTVVLRARRRGQQVLLQVWDSGIGIARADQARIFDDYYQANNPARRLREGLGLGLGLVRRLAQSGDYGLRLRSREGRGSCITLIVPLCSAALVPPPRHAVDDAANRAGHAARPAANRPVLFVDDDETVRDAMHAVLLSEGWHGLVGDSPASVIEQVAVNDWWPSAVVCDYRLGLPIDGLQAIAQIRHEFGLGLPALLITGDMDPAIAERARECGVALLRKPLAMEELLDALTRAIEPHAATSADDIRHAAGAGTTPTASN